MSQFGKYLRDWRRRTAETIPGTITESLGSGTYRVRLDRTGGTVRASAARLVAGGAAVAITVYGVELIPFEAPPQYGHVEITTTYGPNMSSEGGGGRIYQFGVAASAACPHGLYSITLDGANTIPTFFEVV